ncbi:PPR containing plant-like protein [Heracleum sosnowskyi]|uniref:PPR containing plant-like protein n=1 Tax=Heracleum sosnowskyi TaxID=360622 RepID=A0AAD8J1U6_9APIA|nr:PPR containing plant-like protein [Heracleum sosnowskyi]
MKHPSNPLKFYAKSTLFKRAIQFHTHSSSCSTEIVGPMFAGKISTIVNPRLRPHARCSQDEAIRNFMYLDETLRGLIYSGRLVQAIELLCRSEVAVESQTYRLLLQECIFKEDYKKGRRIHAQMVIVGFVPDEYLKVKLLILYAKSGSLETAHILFDQLLEKTVISWNAMIGGYVQNNLEVVGLNLYHSMRQCGFRPDQFTFSSVLRACATLPLLEQGKRAHCLLIKSQNAENVVVNSALIDMYFKCSCPYDGQLVFDTSPVRNVITWTSLISGYGQQGRVVEVLASFNKMISEKFKPNYVTFLAVLCACSHGGLVNEGWEYFLSMTRDFGIQPRGKHYAAVVDILARAGRLEEAYAFVRDSPCKELSVIWGSLLEACKMHGNMDVMKFAARKYFELEPDNAGKYVVLSNAYAAVGLWDNVSQIRNEMKEMGLKKEPSFSMIEDQKEAHYFYMGHNAHKNIERIYEVIKALTRILKDDGDVPDMSRVWQED